MSTKHLRRLLEAKEQEEARKQENCDVKEGGEEGEEPLRGPVNRFAVFEDDEGGAERSADEGCEHVERPDHTSSGTCSKERGERKTNKKKKKKQKGKGSREVDEEQLLAVLSLENSLYALTSEDYELLGVEQLLKTDPRLFDAAAELKRTLGKAFKESTATSSRSHRSSHGAGRLVKQKRTWPPVKNLGLSMVFDREEGEVKWFKFVHNSHYEELERLCWAAEDTLDHRIAEEVLMDNPYHLNSLLLLANVFRMQEDITQSCDIIERGVFYCDQSMATTFQPSSFYHRVDYLDYENRAFYLLLHRHMLNCVYKRCFETALNYSKLILMMDPQRDPLAILLIIDTIAVKAKQYKWLKDFNRCCKEWKNLDKLPNFCYSVALAEFLGAKNDDDLADADEQLTNAICAFPGMVTMLLDKMQVEPDALVESHRHLGTFAANKETDGLKLIYKIYASETTELWKVPETLSWLEHVTRECALNEKRQVEMDDWKEKRQRLFVGVPPNIRRLAVLLGLESSSSGVTDPVPPVNGRARYTRTAEDSLRPDSFLSGFVHSIWPDYDSQEHLRDVIQRLGQEMGRVLFRQPGNTEPSNQPEPHP